MPIYEGYGLTETCAPATVNTERYSGHGGPPAGYLRISVAEDGEVLIRGDNITDGIIETGRQRGRH